MLFSCQSKHEKLVQVWEKEHNQCAVLSIHKLEECMPFLAKDSAIILEVEYQSTKQERMAQLKAERDSLIQAIAIESNEYETLENEMMKRYFKKALQRMNGRLEQLEKNIQIYAEQPELTQLHTIAQEIEDYHNDSLQILGYVYRAEFLGKQGMLPESKYSKSYLFDTTHTFVLAEIKN